MDATHTPVDNPHHVPHVPARWRTRRHKETHYADRVGWLRAAVLGANDGIVSTASLVVGIAAAEATKGPVLMAGVAGLVAGAMSMAAGEYVSVSSQSDTERADLDRERRELEASPSAEREELAAIYMKRGLDRELARQVADQLMAHDALGAHARDELGMSDMTAANPLQAAGASAASFSIGAALPLVVAWATPEPALMPVVVVASLVALAGLGGLSARAGGAPVTTAVARVSFWGAAAMLATAAVGHLFGAVV